MNWGTSGGVPSVYRGATSPVIKLTCIYLLASATYGVILSTSLTSSRESFEVIVSGGSTFARVKLKEIDGMAPQDVERAV